MDNKVPDFNVVSYTEYSSEISPNLEAILQVPQDSNLPAKVIIIAGGKTIQMSFDEFKSIAALVITGMRQQGGQPE